MLFLVATPIGNLADITLRALTVLRSVDLILCEDTRHSQKLLSHYEIDRPLLSFHKFNESSRVEEVVSLLKQGQSLALISDAGSPGIADPGMRLVSRCRREQLAVSALPGACAAVVALSLSGFDSSRFHFVGFLPKGKNERKEELLKALMTAGTTVCYESPQRIVESLQLLSSLDTDAFVGVGRELTKHFEEFVHGRPADLAATLRAQGEMVLLIAGDPERHTIWLQMAPTEHVNYLRKTYGLTRQEALKLAAAQRGVPKREIYRTLNEIRSED
jgi:16S rRNA (cytidine1402-2'-O)-methyltransferase